MRTLELDEIEQVSGGAVPLIAAIVPIVQAAIPVVTTLAAAATTITVAAIAASTVKKAIDGAADLCKNGAEATIKSPTVDMSCSGKKDEQAKGKAAGDPSSLPPGMLKAMMPDFVGAH